MQIALLKGRVLGKEHAGVDLLFLLDVGKQFELLAVQAQFLGLEAFAEAPHVAIDKAEAGIAEYVASADEWIRKLWYIYTMEYYSAIKKNTFESVLMKLKPIIQSEVSQKEKHKYSILTHIYGI